jgi:hypothetical protein
MFVEAILKDFGHKRVTIFFCSEDDNWAADTEGTSGYQFEIGTGVIPGETPKQVLEILDGLLRLRLFEMKVAAGELSQEEIKATVGF